MAKIMAWNDQTKSFCATELRQNRLVSFPTETVYGLGANALSDEAVLKVFRAKGRPQTDPLIVHVHSIEVAFLHTAMTPFQSKCFSTLMEKFSPGPLTLIVNVGPNLSPHVTGGSSTVGIRIPDHPVALELIKECRLPVAAPSANTFGHVSPTSAQHVMDDLGKNNELTIIESDHPCQIGIESTVVKIEDEDKLVVLRPGAISLLQIKDCLLEEGIEFEISNRVSYIKNNNKKNMDSPGQLITHYAPRINTYLLSENRDELKEHSLSFDNDMLLKTIFIDFNGEYLKQKNRFLKYFDLSSKGDLDEASSNLFSVLRESENIDGGEYIILNAFCSGEGNDLANAIFDRMYRATSGKYAKIWRK